MSLPHRIRLLAPALALLAAGCADRGSFPSLAPRPVEKLGFEEPARPAPDVPADAALRSRAAALLAEARAGQAEFASDLPAARTAVAAAGAAQGETWVVAHQAVSRLESARRRTATAMADLDALAVARASQLNNEGDKAALEAAVAEAAGLAGEQSRTIADLLARLRPA